MKLDNMRHYPIKPHKSREEDDQRLLALLQQPHVENKINELAHKLNQTFNNQVKVIVNMRPKARFRNVETGQEYVYEAAMVPYRHTDLARLVLMQAKRPVQEFDDEAYFIFRTVVAGSKTDLVLTDDAGERFMMEGRTFVSYFAIRIFEMIDLANTDEKTLIERAWKP